MSLYSAIVDAAGNGDYTDLSSAITALAAGDSIRVKSGSYTDAIDVSKAIHVSVESGTTFSHANGFTISTTASVEFGNGCTVTNELIISGDGAWCKARNGLATSGLDITGDRVFFDGGGYGTLHDGGTTRQGIDLNTANDAVVQNCKCDTTSGTTGESAIDFRGNGQRMTLRNVTIVDSEEHGLNMLGTNNDSLLDNVCIQGSDNHGMNVNQPRIRLIGCSVSNVGQIGIAIGSSGDDSVVVNCTVPSSSGDKIDVNTNAENCVVVGNRGSGVIDDNSGTSTVVHNDSGTATATVTGTFSSGCNESDIVAGGQTLIITLANAHFRNFAGDTDEAAWQTLLTGDHSEANDWDAEKATILSDAACVRTSDTVVTITLAAAATYSITVSNEIVTLANLDSTILSEESSITPDVTSFTITEGA